MTDIFWNIAAIIAFFVIFTFLIRAVRKKNKEVEQRIKDIEDIEDKKSGTEKKKKPHNAVLTHNPSAGLSGYLEGTLFIIVLVGTAIAGLIYGVFSLLKDESKNNEGDTK